MSREAVEKLSKLGVVVDIQPAWLYLDTRTLVEQFGVGPVALLSAVEEHFRVREHCGRRFGSHAKDRVAAIDQSLQSIPGHVE